MVCNSRSPRRAGALMRSTATRSSCFLLALGCPSLWFQGSPAAPLAARSGARTRSGRLACAATRSKMVASVLGALAIQNRGVESSYKIPAIHQFLGARDGADIAAAHSCKHTHAVAATAKPLDQTGHSQHARCIATPCRNSARNAADASPCKARAKTQGQAIDRPRSDRWTITENAEARQRRRRGHGRSFN